MSPSLQPGDDVETDGYTRFQAPGQLDPNHVDGIGALWLVTHLATPVLGSPGVLNLADATIQITVRGEDFNAAGGKLIFWLCSYLPDGTVQYNYYEGLAGTNWANTGGDFADQVSNEWKTITVTLSPDPADWTYAGNNFTSQGDWADRYQSMPLADTLGAVNATLHLVIVTDSPSDKPSGFLDIADIKITTQTEAVPPVDAAVVPEQLDHGIEDQPLTGVLGPAGYAQPSILIYTLVDGSTQHGSVVINPLTGAYLFTPDKDYSGPTDDVGYAGFKYVVSDGLSTSAAQTVLINFAPINDRPVTNGADEDHQIARDTPFSLSLLKGTDVDGNSLTFSVVDGSVTHGTIVLDSHTGRYTFTPDADFTGSATFDYVVSDGQSISDAKTITLTVGDTHAELLSIDGLAAAFLPNDIYGFVEGIMLLAATGDPNAAAHYGTWLHYGNYVTQDTAQAAIYLQRAVGTVVDASLQLADMYAQGDGVTRDYAHAEALLQAIPQSAIAHYRLGLLYEVDSTISDGATKAVAEYLIGATMGDPSSMYTLGRRYLSGDGIAANAQEAYFWLGVGAKYNPPPGIAQFQQLLQYDMGIAAHSLTADQIAVLNAAIASWTPGQPSPTNAAPVAATDPEAFTVVSGATVHGTLLPGSDADSDPLTFLLVANSSDHGSVVIDPHTGAFTYVADQGFTGIASFSYLLNDGQQSSTPKTVTLTISPATAAVNDMLQTSESASASVDAQHGVLANDIMALDGGALAVTEVGGSSANVGVALHGTYGTLTLQADGSYTYVPDASVMALTQLQSVDDSFSYTIIDTNGALSTATLTIKIQGESGTVLSGDGVLAGTPFDDKLTTLSGGSVLVGYAGDDVIIGSALAPSEMIGGTGNDTYVVSVAGDTIAEYAGEGIDTVLTALSSYTLRPNLEILTYTGTGDFIGAGNELDNVITGGNGRNILVGGDGNDTLISGHGVPSELIGGNGNDTYVVSVAGDTIVEYAGQGIDTVLTALSAYTLRPNLEVLTYTGTGDFVGAGNELDNVITGGNGRNVLVGGDGNDTLIAGHGVPSELIGGNGNDTYVVSIAGDTIVEYAGQGVDTVLTALASYTLRPNLENLTYTGTGDFIGAGNELDNVITGGDGRNILVGGDGNDTLIAGHGSPDELIGGYGDDTYVVGVASDTIVEYAGQGIDTVLTALSSFTLRPNVEILTYTGTGDFVGSGNELDNVITGGIGHDTLTGGAGDDTLIGGLGDDILAGGIGNDRFVFNSVADSSPSTGVDTIIDFTPGSDKIDLSAIDAISTTPAHDAFTFIGNADFSEHAGELRYSLSGANTVVEADINGDGIADVQIILTSHLTLNPSDFLL